MNLTATNSSDILAYAGFQTVSALIAGSLRRSKLPTPAFVALAVIQAASTTLAWVGIQKLQGKIGFWKKTDNDPNDTFTELLQVKIGFWKKTDKASQETYRLGNYILSQVTSIGLTLLAVKTLSKAGYNLVYDMAAPAISKYDAGSLYCIVAQSTLVTLFARTMKDMYNQTKKAFSI